MILILSLNFFRVLLFKLIHIRLYLIKLTEYYPTMRRVHTHLPRLMDQEDSLANPLWKRIWKFPVQEKLRFFLWQFVHAAFLTNERRFLNHLSLSSACLGCSADSEAVLHIIWDCPHAPKVWMLMGLASIGIIFMHKYCFLCECITSELQGLGYGGYYFGALGILFFYFHVKKN